MGTALKILFSGDSMLPDSTVTQRHKKAKVPFQLTRGEIVALFNAFGRLVCYSVFFRGHSFGQMMDGVMLGTYNLMLNSFVPESMQVERGCAFNTVFNYHLF